MKLFQKLIKVNGNILRNWLIERFSADAAEALMKIVSNSRGGGFRLFCYGRSTVI